MAAATFPEPSANPALEALMTRVGDEIERASLYWMSAENALLWERARRFRRTLIRRGKDDDAVERAAWRFVRRGERRMAARFEARTAAGVRRAA